MKTTFVASVTRKIAAALGILSFSESAAYARSKVGARPTATAKRNGRRIDPTVA